MPERHLYEYAVIRYVPRIEREEFVNVGLVMMCKRQHWMRAQVHVDEMRLSALYPDTELDELKTQLQSFVKIASGGCRAIGELEPHERFRWLTAVRSACVQTSRPHPGLSDNLDDTFGRLFSEYVLI